MEIGQSLPGYIFLYDALMIQKIQQQFKIPLQFIGLAYIDGYKLFRFRPNIVACKIGETRGVLSNRGNYRVFGAVYRLENPFYNMMLLDSYYYCSQSRLNRISKNDMRVRTQDTVTLYTIETIEDLLTHQYRPVQSVKSLLYTYNHLDDRCRKHINYGRYRLVDGIDVPSYKTLFAELNIPETKEPIHNGNK